MDIIGVDTGNKAIKTPGVAPFSTGLVRHGETEPAIKGDTLYWEGKYYSLTEQRTPYRQDKTQDDTYFILVLIAIAKSIMQKTPGCQHYAKSIGLALGLPPQHMKLKSKYYDYFSKGGRNIHFLFGRTSFDIVIKRVFVYPQGFSVTAEPKIQELIKRYPRSYVVDIGGYTTDIIRFVGKGTSYFPDLSFCESYDHGIIELLSKVESALRVQCGNNVDDYMAENILMGNQLAYLDPKFYAVAKEVAANYTTELLRSIGEQIKDDFKTSFFIFMGGGSNMMKSNIIDYIGNERNTFFVDDVSANAKGFELMARAESSI